jgi:hypothetical protein
VSASDAAAVIVACASVAALLVLLYAIRALAITLQALRRTIDDLRRETLPVVAELRSAAQQANNELARVDTLLGTAESISATVDSASRLAYLAFSNPLIKTLAFASGTGRAARRLRRARENGAG